MPALLALALAFMHFGQMRAQNAAPSNGTTAVSASQATYLPAPTRLQCADRFRASSPVSILMVADAGSLSGIGEAAYMVGLLQNQYIAPQDAIPCQSITTGTLLGQPVVVITSGIGPEAAALCVAYITECASNVKELIYSGTSGWSAQVGGALNAVSGVPDSCTRNVAKGPSDILRLGDVAITPYSVNWECRLASWSEQANEWPNICTYPEENAGPRDADLYGKCVFSTKTAASTELADELVAATKTPEFAANALALQGYFNSSLLYNETKYWSTTATGTGNSYPPLPVWTAPVVYDYTRTVEIDGQFFFSGTPWDMVARNYSALTLNIANNSTFTQADVFAVNAEEGVGVSAALELHNSLVGVPKIPYTFVRGNSDYLYPAPKQVSTGVWEDNPKSPATNFSKQYKFAIQTVSTVILTAFQLRCAAAGNAAANCAYRLPPL